MAEKQTDLAPIDGKIVPLRDGKAAKKRQREVLHQLLANDDEYVNMPDYIGVPSDIERNIDHDVAQEIDVAGVKDVMKLVYLDVQGYSAPALAKEMGVSHEIVQKIRKSEAYKSAREALLSEIIATSRKIMEVTTIKAVKTLTECMESKNEKVKLAAAVEVLNRTGLSAPQKIELTTHNDSMMNYTDEELKEILRSQDMIEGTAEVLADGSK